MVIWYSQRKEPVAIVGLRAGLFGGSRDQWYVLLVSLRISQKIWIMSNRMNSERWL